MLYDGSAFLRHTRSGISRYFAELVGEFRDDPQLGVEAVTPFRWVANEHLSGRFPKEYRRVPLPGRLRAPVLERMNQRAARGIVPCDVVHHALYEPALLEALPGRKRVTTIYDFTLELFPELFPWNREQVLAEKLQFIDACDVLLCISETTRDDLRRFHPGLDKPIIVTPLGVAGSFFQPTAVPSGLPERYLLHVGARYDHKNVDLILRAFSLLHVSDPDLRLVLCGAGPEGEQARLEELGIAEKTLLLRVGDDELPGLYAGAQAFIFPSRYEGFGLPVVEAMAAGCPVVITDTPALLEVAGDVAVVVGGDRPEELVAALEPLLADAELREQLRAKGRLRARPFSWRRTAEETARAYDLALKA
ncbi:hypothetical protein GCM10011584_32720 [Nocardioides phosphati]|uniref:Glycosyltransferase family 4 protein n=1 Tax=Nocardioides phosphati TaxID=1867775 RepID=A0ABQ2NG30_9ACTN|nr:hypothetical protein GCM10011584_32720 [Nocardioides phosphati]